MRALAFNLSCPCRLVVQVCLPCEPPSFVDRHPIDHWQGCSAEGRCTMRCAPGLYERLESGGNLLATCNTHSSTTEWEMNSECAPCPALPNASHTNVTCGGLEGGGAWCWVACAPGFTAVRGSHVRICSRTGGAWSGIDLLCVSNDAITAVNRLASAPFQFAATTSDNVMPVAPLMEAAITNLQVCVCCCVAQPCCPAWLTSNCLGLAR